MSLSSTDTPNVAVPVAAHAGIEHALPLDALQLGGPGFVVAHFLAIGVGIAHGQYRAVARCYRLATESKAIGIDRDRCPAGHGASRPGPRHVAQQVVVDVE